MREATYEQGRERERERERETERGGWSSSQALGVGVYAMVVPQPAMQPGSKCKAASLSRLRATATLLAVVPCCSAARCVHANSEEWRHGTNQARCRPPTGTIQKPLPDRHGNALIASGVGRHTVSTKSAEPPMAGIGTVVLTCCCTLRAR